MSDEVEVRATPSPFNCWRCYDTGEPQYWDESPPAGFCECETGRQLLDDQPREIKYPSSERDGQGER